MTAPAQDSKAQRKKTRIAHLMLPQIDADSALLPTDRWIVKTTWELIRDNKSVHKTVGGMAGFALAGLATLAAGVFGAIALATVATAGAAAVGVAAVGGAYLLARKAQNYAREFKTETLPSIRGEVGKKYLEYKVAEVKSAWLKNMEDKRKAREAEKAAKAATPKVEAPKVEAPKVDAPKVETPKTETPKAAEAKPAEATPATPEKKPAEKKSLGGAFGEWAIKQATERARKMKEKELKDDAAPVTPPATPPATKNPPTP